MTLLHVAPRNTPLGPTPRVRRPATKYRVVARWRNTRTGADEIRLAESLDGLWAYERTDHRNTLWDATYTPTGQSTGHVYGSLRQACEATAGGLLDEFRRAAYVAALVEGTVDGQRWLGVHARIAAGDQAAAECRCTCGGLLFTATNDGRYAHLDACDDCYTHGTGGVDAGCAHRDGHRFCAPPTPAVWALGCGARAARLGGISCGRAGVDDCCSACCHGE